MKRKLLIVLLAVISCFALALLGCGENGTDGKDGKDGVNGVDGADGQDGKTPHIGANGNWWIGETDTGISAGGKDGENGENGVDGKGVKSAYIDGAGNLILVMTDGSEINCGKVAIDAAGESLRYLAVKEDGVITGYNCVGIGNVSDMDIVVPAEYNGKPVVGISDAAFYGIALTSVEIGENVTYVGRNAFYKCADLESVTFGKSVALVRESAFEDCEKLKDVTFKGGALCIEKNAFAYCYAMDSVYVSDLAGWCMSEFAGAASNPLSVYDSQNLYVDGKLVTTLNIPGGVESIADYAFYGCDYITGLFTPDDVTSIGNYAFAGTGISDIKLSGNLEAIGEHAFAGCKIPAINLPASLTSAGEYAFANNSALLSVEFGGNLNAVSEGMFSGCGALTEIEIPVTVTGLGDLAFSDCSQLSQITVSEGVQTVGVGTFAGCTSLLTIDLPQSLTRIDDRAFLNCSALTDIVLPVGLKDMGKNILKGCGGLKTLSYPLVGWMTVYPFGYFFGTDSYEGGVSTYQDSTRYYIPRITSVTILKGDELPESAFESTGYLQSVTLPDGIQKIGRSAFEDCTALTSLNLPDSITEIGTAAFYNCRVNNLKIPSKVTVIESDAYRNCRFTEKLVIPQGVTTIYAGAFRSISASEIEIPDSVTAIYGSVFAGNTRLEKIKIPAIEEAGANILNGCYSLKSVSYSYSAGFEGYPLGILFGSTRFENATLTEQYVRSGDELTAVKYYIPDSLTEVEITGGAMPEGAFYKCGNVTKVVLADSVERIERDTFYQCGVKDITLGKGLKYIGSADLGHYLKTVNYTGSVAEWCGISGLSDLPRNENSELFIGGKKLEGELMIPGGVTRINSSAFENCRAITSVVMQGVEEVGRNAFYGCSALTGITFPDGLTSVEANAFKNCLSLSNVIIPDSVTSIGSQAFLNCIGIAKVKIGEGVTKLNASVFGSCTNLKSVIIPKTVTSVGNAAFYSSGEFTVYYGGTEAEWNNISISETANLNLKEAPRYYYSESEPALNSDGTAYDGNFWHYAEDGVTPVIWVKES